MVVCFLQMHNLSCKTGETSSNLKDQFLFIFHQLWGTPYVFVNQFLFFLYAI